MSEPMSLRDLLDQRRAVEAAIKRGVRELAEAVSRASGVAVLDVLGCTRGGATGPARVAFHWLLVERGRIGYLPAAHLVGKDHTTIRYGHLRALEDQAAGAILERVFDLEELASG